MATLTITSAGGSIVYTTPTAAGFLSGTGRYLMDHGTINAANPRLGEVWAAGVNGAALRNDGLGARPLGLYRVIVVASSLSGLLATLLADCALQENQDAALTVTGPDGTARENCRLVQGYPQTIQPPSPTEGTNWFAELVLMYEHMGS